MPPLAAKSTAKRVASELAARIWLVPVPSVSGLATILPATSTRASSPLESLEAARTFEWSPERASTPTPCWKSAGAVEVRSVREVDAGSHRASSASEEQGQRRL